MSDRDGFLGQFDTIQSLTQTGVVGPNFPQGLTLGRDAVAGNEAIRLGQMAGMFFGFSKNIAYFEDQSGGVSNDFSGGNYPVVYLDTAVVNNIPNCFFQKNQVKLPAGVYYIKGVHCHSSNWTSGTTRGQLLIYNVNTQESIIPGFSYGHTQTTTDVTPIINIIREVSHPYLALPSPTTIELRLNVSVDNSTTSATLTSILAQLLVVQLKTL